MPKRIEVGDLVYMRGNYAYVDDDFGLVTEIIKDKYSDVRYLNVYWLYSASDSTVREEEVSLHKKSVKAYGKFKDKEGLMSVEELLKQISSIVNRTTKDRGG